MIPDVVAGLAAVAIGVAAALLGWPATRFTLHLAAGRDRARRDESSAADGDAARRADESIGSAVPPDSGAAVVAEAPLDSVELGSVDPDGAAPDDAVPGAEPDSDGTACIESAGDSPSRDVDDDGLLRGGLWIGLLERAFVAGGIALGEPTILAVVVAIKGLGRVPELLRSPSAGERFIIGSLASLGVALVVGVIGRALIG